MKNSTSSATPGRVLLLGYRSAVGRALEALGIPYVVWSDVELKVPPRGVTVRVAPFGRTASVSRSAAEALRGDGPFSHVIACTEASVVAASYARRVLGARLSTHTTAHRCHDKLAMKTELRKHDVPMAEFVDGNRERSWVELRDRLGLPLVVKDRRSSGGAGIDVVRDGNDSNVRLRNRIVERFVDAPEASVESFVVNGRVVLENVTEYYRKQHVNIVPASDAVDRPEGVRRISREVIETLGVSWGVTHMEAFLCPDGPLFGEIALRPPGGYIMDLIGLAYDIDAWRAFVSVELELPFEFPAVPKAFAAAVIFHPGAGRVTRLAGFDAIRDHPYVARARLTVGLGDVIDARRSVGKSVGHVLLRGPDRETVLAAIEEIESGLKIEVDSSVGASDRG